MKYDELNALMIEFDRLRLDADRVIRKLRALGVTDLPGDAPNSLKSSDGSPGNLPGEPTEEMVRAALDAWDTCDEPTGTKIMTRTLRAALAAAPRVEAEIPEVTRDDAREFCQEAWGWSEDGHASDLDCAVEGLRAVRARLIARMGAKP